MVKSTAQHNQQNALSAQESGSPDANDTKRLQEAQHARALSRLMVGKMIDMCKQLYVHQSVDENKSYVYGHLDKGPEVQVHYGVGNCVYAQVITKKFAADLQEVGHIGMYIGQVSECSDLVEQIQKKVQWTLNSQEDICEESWVRKLVQNDSRWQLKHEQNSAYVFELREPMTQETSKLVVVRLDDVTVQSGSEKKYINNVHGDMQMYEATLLVYECRNEQQLELMRTKIKQQADELTLLHKANNVKAHQEALKQYRKDYKVLQTLEEKSQTCVRHCALVLGAKELLESSMFSSVMDKTQKVAMQSVHSVDQWVDLITQHAPAAGAPLEQWLLEQKDMGQLKTSVRPRL